MKHDEQNKCVAYVMCSWWDSYHFVRLRCCLDAMKSLRFGLTRWERKRPLLTVSHKRRVKLQAGFESLKGICGVLCRQRLAKGLATVQGVPPNLWPFEAQW
jgi:hypothetical protein